MHLPRKALLLAIIPFVASCSRGYDLSLGEALTSLSRINLAISEAISDNDYETGRYFYTTELYSFEINFSVDGMYYHQKAVTYEEDPEDEDGVSIEEEAEASYYLNEYWYYISEGYGYELHCYGSGDYIYTASLYEELTASAVYAYIRELAATFNEAVASATTQVLSAMQLIESSSGSSYSFFSREEGNIVGAFSYLIGNSELSYDFSYEAEFPTSIEATYGEDSFMATFSNSSYRKTYPSDLELFPIPEPSAETE